MMAPSLRLPWPVLIAIIACGIALGIGLSGPSAARRLIPWPRAARIAAAVLITMGAVLAVAPALVAMPDAARHTLAVTVLMAAWWISMALPLAATSLIPLVLFPVLGVMPAGKVAGNYANNNIFLFMGGFILALGIQRWGLHRRIALHIVNAVGTNPARMVLGFMVATAFLSMWISNTATTLMMLPIALAVISSMGDMGEHGQSSADSRIRAFAPALLLGVAYSASIGGLATPIGTPPNISYLRIIEIIYPQAPTTPFGSWLVAFLPLSVIFLVLAWLILTRVTHRLAGGAIGAGREVVREELASLGPMSTAERRVLVIFVATAILWITRGDLTLGAVRIPGWAGLLETMIGAPFAAKNLHDATVAMTMALSMFLIPAHGQEGAADADAEATKDVPTVALMDWNTAKTLPWEILLLFGGGFALAMAFKESTLSQYLGQGFADVIAGAPALVLAGAICLLLTFLTEVTSNTATTEVMLPILAGAAGAMGEHPALLMLPATLSASCAFMLPIATPPNAIVFSSGALDMKEMVRSGIVLNLCGVVLITLIFSFISAPILGLDLATVPAWAK